MMILIEEMEKNTTVEEITTKVLEKVRPAMEEWEQ